MGEQQRDHVVARTDVADVGFLRAVAEELDPIPAFLEALVHRLDLHVAQLRVRDRKALVRSDQLGETFDGSGHGASSSLVSSRQY
jgi:hypothetical protein